MIRSCPSLLAAARQPSQQLLAAAAQSLWADSLAHAALPVAREEPAPSSPGAQAHGACGASDAAASWTMRGTSVDVGVASCSGQAPPAPHDHRLPWSAGRQRQGGASSAGAHFHGWQLQMTTAYATSAPPKSQVSRAASLPQSRSDPLPCQPARTGCRERTPPTCTSHTCVTPTVWPCV